MSLLSIGMNHASAVRVFTLCLIKSDATKSLWVCKTVKISVNHTFKANDDIPTCILRILVIYIGFSWCGQILEIWFKRRGWNICTGLCLGEFTSPANWPAPNSWWTRSLLLYRWRWSGSLFGSKLDGQSQQTSELTDKFLR